MAMTEISSTIVVADAGPLIHLDELSALDVLGDYSEILVPNAVWNEVARHRPQALCHADLRLIKIHTSSGLPRVDAIVPIYTLHHGEREALTLCLARGIGTLLTDDTAARLAARSLSISTHGTLGLLIRAVRRQLRTSEDVLALLTDIPQKTTLHIRPSLLNKIIQQVQNE